MNPPESRLLCIACRVRGGFMATMAVTASRKIAPGRIALPKQTYSQSIHECKDYARCEGHNSVLLLSVYRLKSGTGNWFHGTNNNTQPGWAARRAGCERIPSG